MGQSALLEVIREEHRECCASVSGPFPRPAVLLPSCGHLQHYTEPSTEPLLATSSALQGSILQLARTANADCGKCAHHRRVHLASGKHTGSTITITLSVRVLTR